MDTRSCIAQSVDKIPISKLGEEMEESPGKRLRRFDANSQTQSYTEVVAHSSGSSGMPRGDGQSSKANEEVAQLRYEIDTSLDQLQAKYDERLANVLKRKEEEWAAERANLETKYLNERKANENLEEKLFYTNWQLKKCLETVKCMTEASERMNKDGNELFGTIEAFLLNK